jgi:hypothetical protein
LLNSGAHFLGVLIKYDVVILLKKCPWKNYCRTGHSLVCIALYCTCNGVYITRISMNTEPWDKIGGYRLFDTQSHILHAFSHFSVCCILSTLEVGIPTASYIASFTFSSKKRKKGIFRFQDMIVT